MTEPVMLSEDELANLRGRQELIQRRADDNDEGFWAVFGRVVAVKDVPALLAHIAALTEERDGLKEANEAQLYELNIVHGRCGEFIADAKSARTSALKEAAEVALSDAGAWGDAAFSIASQILALSQK